MWREWIAAGGPSSWWRKTWMFDFLSLSCWDDLLWVDDTVEFVTLWDASGWYLEDVMRGGDTLMICCALMIYMWVEVMMRFGWGDHELMMLITSSSRTHDEIWVTWSDLSWWCFDDLLCEIGIYIGIYIGIFRWLTGSWWYMWFGRLMGCGFAIFRWLTTSWHKVTDSHISSTDMRSWRLNALWFIMRGGGTQMSYYEVMIR